MDRAKLTDFISDDRMAEIVRAEREGRLQFRKNPPYKTCRDCMNFLRNRGKASGYCVKKTEPHRYCGQRPRMMVVARSKPACKKNYKPKEERYGTD